MNPRSHKLFVAMIAVVAIQTLAAQPQTLQIGKHSLTKASHATRSRLFGLVDIYRVSLFVPPTDSTFDTLRKGSGPVALRVDILYEGSLPEEIPSEWQKELLPALGPSQRQSLARAYARLESSDSIEIRFAPGEGSSVLVSGQHVLADKGFELMAGFLDIWMGQTPVSEDVKRELLRGLRQH